MSVPLLKDYLADKKNNIFHWLNIIFHVLSVFLEILH